MEEEIEAIDAFQVKGWYKTLPEEEIGKSTTISDGAIFSDSGMAVKYAILKMAECNISQIKANPKVVDIYLDDLKKLIEINS